RLSCPCAPQRAAFLSTYTYFAGTPVHGSRSIIMKRRHQGVIAASMFAAVITLAHGTAAAQQLAPGSIEIPPPVSLRHWNVKREGYGNVDNFTQLEFTPSVGVCLTQHHEITTALVIHHEDANGSGVTRLGALTGYQYNFASSNGLIPFVGIGLGANFG